MTNKFLSIAALLCFSSMSHAAFVTYNDFATFISDTGATSATGALPNPGLIGGGSTTVNGVTFTMGPAATQLYIGTGVAGGDWTPLIGGNDIALSSPEDLDVDFGSSVFSAGFDFVEPDATSDGPGCNASCVD